MDHTATDLGKNSINTRFLLPTEHPGHSGIEILHPFFENKDAIKADLPYSQICNRQRHVSNGTNAFAMVRHLCRPQSADAIFYLGYP